MGASDQGSQYVSLIFGERCRDTGVRISMGAQGDAYDKRRRGAFFASLEKDLLRRRLSPTRQEARTARLRPRRDLLQPIRLQSTLDYLSPVEYENMNLKKEEKAA